MSKSLIDFFLNNSYEVIPNTSIRVVDGDTLHLKKDDDDTGNKGEYLRLTSINSPERLTQEGKVSTSITQDFIDNNKVLLILRLGKDKYNRTITAVFPISIHTDLSSHLLSSNAATFKSYDHPFSHLYNP